MEFDYYDVSRDAERLREMLGLTGNQRKVPVVVREGQATIGFNGA